MRAPFQVFLGSLIGLLILAVNLGGETAAPESEHKSLTVVFNDGRQQSIRLDDIARIEFKSAVVVVFKDGHQQHFPIAEVSGLELNSSPLKDSPLGRNHFLGKWKVGQGNGMHFYITLEPNGVASKTLGASHGTWMVVDGEARISWDDGWHDAIRKVGTKHEKRAFEPGKNFSDEPSNVTEAENTTAQPI